MKFSITHDYNISADDLWKHLFDPELEASVKQAADLAEFDVKSRKEGDLLIRDVRVLPNIDLPGPLRKVFGDSIGYREEDRVPQDGSMEYSWKARPDTLADKVKMEGVFRVEPIDEGRCRRVIEGEVQVKIFGVGGMAEKFMLGELKKSYAKVAAEQERWIKAKG